MTKLRYKIIILFTIGQIFVINESTAFSCGQNEVVGCQNSCSYTDICVPECFCKDGFYRNEAGECVSEELCGENEVPTSCLQAICERRECSDIGKPVLCVRVDPTYCVNGCLCKSGYLRDEYGVCVPIEQCPNIECDSNEVFDVCPPICPGEQCGVDPRVTLCLPNPQPGEPDCNPRCRCKDNYYRNEYGYCVTKDQCLNCNKKNEIKGCKTTCPPQTCESIGKTYHCPIQTKICIPECRCQSGFYRNKIGECISKENCLKCTGPNEYFTCGSACDNVCSTLAYQNQTNCSIKNIVCNPKCYCFEGYARNKNNTCVPISKCPPQPTCRINEIYDDCPATCPPKTCDALGRAYKCKAPPKRGDPECKPGCRCADGFYKNKQGVCVQKNKCPKPPGVTCGVNEEYNSCANGGCGRWTCSQTGIICIDLIEGGCREGCRCKNGLLRADNGTCIPADQCPINCYGENEVRGCKSTCPPQTCESIGKKYFCPRQPVGCTPECRCKNGFYRNKIGECISKQNCLKCTGPNEYFTCGVECDNVCATLASQNQTNCPNVNVKCNPKCYCVEGYARDSNNTCIKISKCPKSPQCGTNEVFDSCPKLCPPQRCDVDPSVIRCAKNPSPGDPKCQPGCRCVDDYLRNKIGQCVSKDQCDITTTNSTGDGIKKFEEGNVAFTEKILYEAALASPGKSLILSPFSVLFLLAQLALYASGTSLTQLLLALKLSSKTEIRSVIPTYLDMLSFQRNVTFELSERIYINTIYPVTDSFKKDSRDMLKTDPQNLDFCTPTKAAQIINEWVALKTNNMINNLVSPDSLTCDTVLVLTNAIYFKGDWKDPFDPKKSRQEDFYVDENKTLQVNMMKRTAYYRYADISYLDAQVIELPYKSNNFTLFICLPKSKDGINYIINKIKDSNYSIISNTLESLTYNNVHLSLPSFNTSTTSDLKELLIKAKIDALFDAKTSGLDGILQNSQPTQVSSAVQKAKITVNELGSEAAAANAIVVSVTSVQLDSIYFIANQPFFYFILYKGTPIFCGTYYGDDT